MPPVVRAPRRRAIGPIRITLPARVAYDPNLLKKSITNLAERLGCPSCFSGADCLLEMERDFLVDPELQSSPRQASIALDPSPLPWKQHQYTVGLSAGVKFDLKKVLAAVDKVIDIIGPHPCISGYDVLLRDELRTIVVNEKLQAQAFAERF